MQLALNQFIVSSNLTVPAIMSKSMPKAKTQKCIYCSTVVLINRKTQKLNPHRRGATQCIGQSIPLSIHIEHERHSNELGIGKAGKDLLAKIK